MKPVSKNVSARCDWLQFWSYDRHGRIFLCKKNFCQWTILLTAVEGRGVASPRNMLHILICDQQSQVCKKVNLKAPEDILWDNTAIMKQETNSMVQFSLKFSRLVHTETAQRPCFLQCNDLRGDRQPRGRTPSLGLTYSTIMGLMFKYTPFI